MKRLFKYLTYTIFTLAILYAAAAIALHIIVQSKGNRYFAALVSKASGYPTKITGKVSLEFFPSLGLKITRITFGNPKDFHINADVPYLAHADELDVKVALLPLFIGQVEPKRLYLKSANLYLAQNRDGQQNWAYRALRTETHSTDKETALSTASAKTSEISEDGDTGSALNLSQALPKLLVSNSNFHWINRANKEAYSLKYFNLTLTPNNFSGSFRFNTQFDLSQELGTPSTTHVKLKARLNHKGNLYQITGLDLSGARQTPQGKKSFSLSGDATLNEKSRTFEMKNMESSYAHVQVEGPLNIHWRPTDAGRMIYEFFQGSFAEGKLKSNFSLNSQSKQFSWKTSAEQINVSRLIQSFQPSLSIDGTLAFSAQLSGNLTHWRNTLTGQGHLELAGVRMKDIDILGVIDQGISLLKRQKNKSPGGKINSFGSIVGDVQIRNGVISTTNLKFQSSKIFGLATGKISLPNHSMSLRISAHDQRYPKWTIPLKITGSLDAPKVSLDMSSLTKDIIQNTIKNRVHDLLDLKKDLFH